MSDLQRITADLARARNRVAEIESGKRGVPPSDSHHINPQRALEGQLNAQRQHVARLERELVLAKLDAPGGWPASAIIAAMEGRKS